MVKCVLLIKLRGILLFLR